MQIIQSTRNKLQAIAVSAGALQLAILFVILSLFGDQAQSQVGVSSFGSPGYSQPIPVPPGIAGMAPNISLNYAGGGVNGPVGYGWSVQGISMITRCPASILVDGSAGAVMYKSTDRLCLDGQRLIQADAGGVPLATQNNDAAGRATSASSEFRTERDIFARIRGFGIADNGDGSTSLNIDNGPAYFKVWTKSGQVYEYGTNPAGNHKASIYAQGTSAVALWAVSRISDAVGNYIDFQYYQRDFPWGSGTATSGAMGHEWNIAEIHYTGTITQVPNNKVVFAYQDRPASAQPAYDRAEAYQLNSKNLNVQQLTAIRTYVNSPNPTQLGLSASAIPVSVMKINYDRGAISGRSRVVSISECAGSDETKCRPGPHFNYQDGAEVVFVANSAFGASSVPLSTLKMTDSAGRYGTLTGDFNGDGRTDIIRWSNIASENQLWLSKGGGRFEMSAAFGITNDVLFSSDGCYYSMVADFNGDGLSDILRVAKATCSPATNLLFLSLGDGHFNRVILPSNIDFENLAPVYTSWAVQCSAPLGAGATSVDTSQLAESKLATTYVVPPVDSYGQAVSTVAKKVASVVAASSPRIAPSSIVAASGNCSNSSRTLGKRFFLIDLNGDGKLDIVTTLLPPYRWNSSEGPRPTDQALCRGYLGYAGLCSRVFIATAGGNFTEKVDTNIANTSLYSPMPDRRYNSNPYWNLPDIADINGDGLKDILSISNGRWRSTGDGNFVGSSIQDASQLCGAPIDFNGDGRMDCLRPDAVASNQVMTVSYGAASSSPILQFNLTASGDNLFATDASGRQTVGLLVGDFDGDGRQDILRWGPTPADNGIYLSNGDASFRSRLPAGLGNISRPLQSVDGTTSFVTGDFLGVGSLQIRHLKQDPVASGDTIANTNQLYQRVQGPTPDQLLSVVSPSGLKTALTFARLTADADDIIVSQRRYVSDRESGAASAFPLVDLKIPLEVVITTMADSGVGSSSVKTEYAYRGLKAAMDGRGMLGFRQTVQQNVSPNGDPLSVWTSYLPDAPYSGVAKATETRSGAWTQPNASLLSNTVNVYCDKSSATDALLASDPTTALDPASLNENSPCVSSAKIKRPYLRKSVEAGADLVGVSLPTITTFNSYNDLGDPSTIWVTTAGKVDGSTYNFTKTTVNTFCTPGSTLADGTACPNKTDGDNWILGRLNGSTVTNSVPNVLAVLRASPGSQPYATATTGVAPPNAPPSPMSPALLSAILQLLLED